MSHTTPDGATYANISPFSSSDNDDDEDLNPSWIITRGSFGFGLTSCLTYRSPLVFRGGFVSAAVFLLDTRADFHKACVATALAKNS